mmetsp:Transcript_52580/g.151593  ORF Transcript_52580/g.151593 Transcript_52580/m.151593 type:complete len:201 (-) Transcript_52580:556-1158(-)
MRLGVATMDNSSPSTVASSSALGRTPSLRGNAFSSSSCGSSQVEEPQTSGHRGRYDRRKAKRRCPTSPGPATRKCDGGFFGEWVVHNMSRPPSCSQNAVTAAEPPSHARATLDGCVPPMLTSGGCAWSCPASRNQARFTCLNIGPLGQPSAQAEPVPVSQETHNTSRHHRISGLVRNLRHSVLSCRSREIQRPWASKSTA